MSTIVVVKKNGETAIAADTLTSCSSIKISATYKTHGQKILRFGDTYLGFVGWAVNQDVFASLMEKHPGDLHFHSSRHIFETVLKIHPVLKEKFFLRESEDAYESSGMNILVANPHGIFEVNQDRKVTEYEFFWANGSGTEYALGAMFQAYDHLRTAREIAVAGVLAATEFDQYSGLPYHAYTCKMQKAPEFIEPVMI
jgi:ATP-dependent protease HslVU (ClpYQ) peptidase subunit